MKKFIQQLKRKKEIYLRIKVRPNASNTIYKNTMDDDTLKIDIAAVPEKNKANIELIKYLAKEFAINKNNVKIVSGSKEKIKLIKFTK